MNAVRVCAAIDAECSRGCGIGPCAADAGALTGPYTTRNRNVGDWLWCELMDYCKERGIPPASNGRLFELVARARAAWDGQQKPIDMLLFCPKCGKQHIDHAEPAVEHDHGAVEFEAWNNPPHRSHLCHTCGTIWRPADVPTNGVASIETRGKADTWANEQG